MCRHHKVSLIYVSSLPEFKRNKTTSHKFMSLAHESTFTWIWLIIFLSAPTPLLRIITKALEGGIIITDTVESYCSASNPSVPDISPPLSLQSPYPHSHGQIRKTKSIFI